MIKNCLITALVVLFLCNPLLAAAQELQVLNGSATFGSAAVFSNRPSLSYPALMRAVQDIKSGKNTADQPQLIDDFEQFIRQEKESLQNFTISAAKKAQYFELLETQLNAVKNPPPLLEIADDTALPIAIPEKPASFKFNSEEIQIKSFQPSVSEGFFENPIDNILSRLSERALALDASDFPAMQDLLGDNRDVFLTTEIQELARTLRYNPVQIANFIRKNIVYEPYYGAKKGSLGCLEEQYCNDIDASSLTIALLRASGIPARYKKSIVIAPAEELKNLLGVDETKTAYAVLALNKVPVYTISGNNIGNNFDNADFSKETHLAVEWVRVEAFYDYDERGANIDGPGNAIINFFGKFEFVELSKEAKEQLLKTTPKKQWIPIDTLMQPYGREAREIVPDTAKFDSQQFWNDYLKYQGQLSPLEKYTDDLLKATGKDIRQNQYQSNKKPLSKTYEILPPTLPYYPTKGQVDGALIAQETWSVLPNTRRPQVRVSLLRAQNKTTILTQNFPGSQINNVELNLLYKGAKDIDEKVIEKYGGIHATPAALVDIVPYLQSDINTYETAASVKIGEPLILQFEYVLDGNVLYADQKFSIAGNQEGMYMSLSKTQDDPSLDTDSHVLLRGNVGLARKFLQRVETGGDVLKKSLDYEYNTVFSRAVVTQNRILSEVNGVPTTFDFKGLSIDASSYINDYSNRGNYKTHRKDFRLLWGLAASYQEAKLFMDITGLDAISTVNGLQYAAADPQTYTVHTITQQNAAVIDQLQLSQNTKTNLKAEVAKGNTVTTPDKPVSKGVWKGILYTSIAPDGSGMYAIGEQVGNGGWSSTPVQVTSWNDVLKKPRRAFQAEVAKVVNGIKEQTKFLYEDKPGFINYSRDYSVACTISKPDFDYIKMNTGWQPEYGFPCAWDEKHFGSPNIQKFNAEIDKPCVTAKPGEMCHLYVLTIGAAKFKSPANAIPQKQYGYWPGYDYWISDSDVKTILERDKNSDVNNVTLNGLWGFNTAAGTYFYNGVGGNENVGVTVYYLPTDKSGKVVSSDMRHKFDTVQFTLGFPKDAKKPADESFAGTKGFYQDFVGGQIYLISSPPAKIYYVPGKIAEYYNNDQNAITDNNGQKHPGSGGKLGFPLSDPLYIANTNETIQKFEWKMIRSVPPNIELVGYNDTERRRNNKRYADRVRDLVVQGVITDVEAFAQIADYLAYTSSRDMLKN